MRETSRGITADPIDIRVSHTALFGDHLYKVFTDEVTFDTFFADTPLTHAEMIDVQAGYREGLTGYRSPC